MIVVYGISNCDTVKKARAWLAEREVSYRFHDFKKDGASAADLDRWIAALGWQALVNRRGTTWRKLSPDAQDAVVDAASARALMLREPSVIKRPVVHWPQGFSAGFDASEWTARLAARHADPGSAV